ncbi:MAG: hypothetical protein RL616_2272, partial [Verrucomicrobiota bacterium]
AAAESTNDFVEAIIQGRKFALQILAQHPTEGFTKTGVLQYRDQKGVRSELPIKSEVSITEQGWQTVYEASFINGTETLTIFHPDFPTPLTGSDFPDNKDFGKVFIIGSGNDQLGSLPHYRFSGIRDTSVTNIAKADYHMIPFAGSDFCYADLGLEFFHWPAQKVLKKEIHRSCACTVLESTNPNPTTNGYSRVVSWVDTESLGIVEAYAYDFNGKKLKDFYPKDIKKVNGQWQVQTLVMENVQTGSRSRLEFDLKQ